MKNNMPKLLVIGATGQVGWELMRTLAPLGQVLGASMDPGPLHVDLSHPGSLSRLVQEHSPDMVINAAAYTAVDKAESEPEVARMVNADALKELGRVAWELSIPVVHYSTDFVFGGESDRPYRESDEPAPLSVYGKTKLDGEIALQNSGTAHIILRTSWVYGTHGHNFMLTMRRLAGERDELRVVDDQIGAPTWSRMLAETTAQIVARLLQDPSLIERVQGIYHLTASGSTSWHGFAKAIMELSGSHCRLVAIPTSEYPSPAKRPAYSVLDNERIDQVFGIRLPDWHYSLRQCLGQ